MAVISGNLRELSGATIRSIVNALGGTAVLLTSKENFVSRTQNSSLRSRIVEFVASLQDKHGAVLTEKFNIVEPARSQYIEWYLEQRADDIVKNPDKDYQRWAIVHLQDAIKYRKELVGTLGLKIDAKEAAKEPVTA
jgi:hypothetical protein